MLSSLSNSMPDSLIPKIILIHPLGTNWTKGEKDLSRIANIMPPIGLCSLAAYLEKHNIPVYIHDCYAFPNKPEKIFDLIRKEKIGFAGFSATTSAFPDAIRIATEIKSRFKTIKTVFGGPHISALKETLMEKFQVIDFGIPGEGEQTLLQLLQNQGEKCVSIKGLIYREENQIYFTGRRENISDIDSLPFPAYNKLSMFPKAYQLPIFSYPKAPSTTAISSRGCPYQCSYCDRSVFLQSFRFHSPQYMLELLKYLNQTFNIRHINFYDDLFTFKKKRVLDFCELLLSSRLKMTFNCAARAEHLDDEILMMLKLAGCWMISLGIETGDQDLLKLHRSTNNLDLIKEKIYLIKKHKIRVKGLFMMGLPGETESSIDKSIKFVLDSPLDDFNLTRFTPFPGSPLYHRIKDYGAFEENWELMNCLNFCFIPDGFTSERLEQRYHEFYRTYFKRISTLWRYTKMVYQSPDSWLRFLKNLPSFLSITKTYKK